MVTSALTKRFDATGECLPCGPPIMPAPARSAAQDNDGLYVVGAYDPDRNPSSDLEVAVERATAGNKRILIQVGGNWCIWCHILDDYIKGEEEVASALRQSFLIVKVNFDPSNRNEVFLSKYPTISGYPHIYVLEKDGEFLHSQDTSELEEGRSYSRTAILAFIRKWAPQR
jgi:hypothetical protein